MEAYDRGHGLMEIKGNRGFFRQTNFLPDNWMQVIWKLWPAAFPVFNIHTVMHRNADFITVETPIEATTWLMDKEIVLSRALFQHGKDIYEHLDPLTNSITFHWLPRNRGDIFVCILMRRGSKIIII